MILGLMLLAIRTPLLSIYSISEEVYRQVSAFILIQSAVTCVMSYQMPAGAGIIRGGNTRCGLMMEVIWAWIVVLPAAYLEVRGSLL